MTTASPKLDQRADNQVKPANISLFFPADPPARFLSSKWLAENWKARKAALARQGLVEIRLQQMDGHPTPRADLLPTAWCQIVEAKEPGAPRLISSATGEFAVSADGELHCLEVDLQMLTKKESLLDGHSPDCGGGAFRPTEPPIWLYIVPPGVTLGNKRTVQVPYYNVVVNYKERCPLLP